MAALHDLPAIRRIGRDDAAVLAVTAISAAAAGVALAGGHRTAAVAVSLLPFAGWLAIRPLAPFVALGATLPIITSLTSGRGGFNLTASDLLLVAIAGAIIADCALHGVAPAIRALRPVAPPIVQYGLVILLLLPFHTSVGDIAKTGQRFELFLLPMIVGAYASLKDRHVPLLTAYVVSCSMLAVLWPLYDFGLQKNPVGQLIGNAVLVVVGLRSMRRFVPLLAILVPGLLLTGSRGALAATALGVTVILVVHGLQTRVVVTRVLPGVVLAAVAFTFLPPGLQQRLTTYSAGQDTTAQYALYIRQQYTADAKRIIRAHPWIGIGIGNYLGGDPYSGTQARDPHNVLLLQAAEGGYLLAGSFVLAVAGVLLALVRMRRLEIAVLAAAVFAATFAHGLVDVYWVRVTPVLSWLLVGMACGAFLRARSEGA